jgi:hypothetical protein
MIFVEAVHLILITSHLVIHTDSLNQHYVAAANELRSQGSSARNSETPELKSTGGTGHVHGVLMALDNTAPSSDIYRLTTVFDLVGPPNPATSVSGRAGEDPFIVRLESGEEHEDNDLRQLQMPCPSTTEARPPASFSGGSHTVTASDTSAADAWSFWGATAASTLVDAVLAVSDLCTSPSPSRHSSLRDTLHVPPDNGGHAAESLVVAAATTGGSGHGSPGDSLAFLDSLARGFQDNLEVALDVLTCRSVDGAPE